MEDDPVHASPDPASSPESALTDASDPSPLNRSREEYPTPRPPSLRPSADSSPPAMNSSSAPLGPINAARRPGPSPAPRASGLTSDIQAKMKAFSLSRQGAPPSAQLLRPVLSSPQPGSTGNLQTSGFVGGPIVGGIPLQGATPSSPAGPLAGGIRLPPGLSRPGWSSAPTSSENTPRVMSPRPGMGGLAAKRGLKPGGMKLSDAVKSDPASGNQQGLQMQTADTGSQFNKFSNIIDTNRGTLNFKNKAIIHGGGIDFSTGSSFSISLDEVDTIDELGKGNYGTVFKVRHARPKIRRPGMGLRGNMLRQSSNLSSSKSVSEDVSESTPAPGTTGLIMAMKEIRLELEDSKFAAIIMELDILHRCISPFVISFYGAFFQEGSVYICMEHMDGGSIDKIYGEGVPEGVLKKITLSTVMGLKCLKDEHNIIHRDVKPTNILANTRGQVKICDFGVSGNLVASIAKTNIGCQSYMAPERISGGGMAQAGANPGGGTYSVQSDIWSLGLSIIECALGRYPYPPETYDNIFSQLSAIVDGEPPDLPADRFSEAARDFVRGCLNKIPKLRPTYAMLLRHAWLAPLMKPPTIAEDEEEEAAAEAGVDTSFNASQEPMPETADKEVANWVKGALERKKSGKMVMNEKPALHTAPLDAMSGRSLFGNNRAGFRVDDLTHNPGVSVPNPELMLAMVDSKDFADRSSVDGTGEGERRGTGE